MTKRLPKSIISNQSPSASKMYAIVAGNFGHVTKLQRSGYHLLRSVDQILVKKVNSSLLFHDTFC